MGGFNEWCILSLSSLLASPTSISQLLFVLQIKWMFAHFNFLCNAVKSCSIHIVKILSKHHIVKEKKVPYVKREKDVLVKINHPFFVKLYFTFQDKENLCIYFKCSCFCKNLLECFLNQGKDYGLSLAEKGELLDYIRRVSANCINCIHLDNFFASKKRIHILSNRILFRL